VSPLLFICTTTKRSSYKHGCRPRLLYLSRRFPSPSPRSCAPSCLSANRASWPLPPRN
jgi:hypothetical protein